ncbi:MAG: hypothetical protein JWP30_418 [Homoserinimonas sp.]|jgi:hypothetical protein|nr:hypothetical protein [Homoserinimonas sp.]
MPVASTLSGVSPLPESIPVLSPGKHRSPRNGACFMEFASYLAGERWSDHPHCTHPLLAFLARGVNDFTTDEGRSNLAPLIPSVIGLTSADPRVDVAIALRAATMALPVASSGRQRALATGILACERALTELGSAPNAEAQALIDQASHDVPDAWRWARNFTSGNYWQKGLSFTRAGRAIVSTSVLGIAQACIPDPDQRLRAVLASAIDDCAQLLNIATARTAQEPASEQRHYSRR